MVVNKYYITELKVGCWNIWNFLTNWKIINKTIRIIVLINGSFLTKQPEFNNIVTIIYYVIEIKRN